jgi:hypothetical protein
MISWPRLRHSVAIRRKSPCNPPNGKYLNIAKTSFIFNNPVQVLLTAILSLAPSLYHFSKKIGVKTIYQYKLLIA